MANIPAHNTFNLVLKAAQSRVEEFSEAKMKRLKDALEHGLGDLKTKDEMDMYLASYGEIHQDKLLLAFSRLPRKILAEEKVSVIDYGCGQGFASMVLCDVLHHNVGHPDMISDFYAIEPSKECLTRAVNHIHSICPNSRITYFNNPCEDIWRMDIQPESEVVIHLFSNVIDMPDFPREIVADKINRMDNHNNIIVCVSPFYQENGRAKHMDEFGDRLHGFYCYHSFEKHTDDWNKPFSCQIRLFRNVWY